MNNIYHDQLDKLRIISKIKEGDKLDVRFGMDIQNNWWPLFSWLGRFFSKNSKEESIRCLQDLYRSISQTTEQLIESIKQADTSQLEPRIFTAQSFAEKLRGSLTGLENLAKTYSIYPSIVSQIEGIVQDYLWPSYQMIGKGIPEDRWTETMREPIISTFLTNRTM